MQPDNLNFGELTDAERRAKIAAAARALRTWVKTRDNEAPASAPPAAPRAESPSVPAAAPVVRVSAPSSSASPSVTSVFGSFDQTLPDAASGTASPVELPKFKLPSVKLPTVKVPRVKLPPIPKIRWSRRASIATGTALVALLVSGAIYANRSTIAGVWEWIMTPGAGPVGTATTGSVALESVPDAALVSIGDKALGTTPLTTDLAVGTHTLTFRRGTETRAIQVDVVAGESVGRRVDWNAPRTGRLRVESDPPGAAVVVAGRERGVTPVMIDDLPVGTHVMELRSTAGIVERRVTISADRTTQVTEGIYSGFIHVSAPFELTITRDGRRLRLDEQNQLLLPPGPHRLTFENADLNFREVREVQVSPGGRTRLAIVPNATTLTVTATQPAEVFLNGERIGETSIVRHALAIGTHQLLVRSLADGTERQVTVTATAEPVTLDVDFAAP